MKSYASLTLAIFLSATTLVKAATSSAQGTAPTLQEAQTEAAKLLQLYDSNYAARNADLMAQLYSEDGILVSPAGNVIKGRAALKEYYAKRFASGAREHHIHVLHAEAQGNGGFSIADFSVQVPTGAGGFREDTGHILAVYVKSNDGWHLRAVEPSVAAKE